MAKNILMIALVAACIAFSAKATLYLDANVDMWSGMATNIADTTSYGKWLIYTIWYSFAPLVAPVLGTIVAEIYQGTNTIDVNGNSLALGQGLALYGL